MNINKLNKNQRAMKALTGMSVEEFNNVVPDFKRELYRHAAANPTSSGKWAAARKATLKQLLLCSDCWQSTQREVQEKTPSL